MNTTGKKLRFSRISDIIDFRHLERETRRFLYLGFVVAAVFHAVLIMIIPYKRITVKPGEKPRIVTLRLIERRDTEPFMLRKKTLPKRHYERKAYDVRLPAVKSDKMSIPFSVRVPESPAAELLISHKSDTVALPGGVDIDLGISRTPSDRIPIKNRMFDDPGMYHADIIYNPDNKLAIQGYVHIPVIQFEDYKPNDTIRRSINGLANAINRMTNITAIVDNPLYDPPIVYWDTGYPLKPLTENAIRGLTVDSIFVKRPPLVYMIIDRPFKLTRAEMRSFKRYLQSRGILIIENGKPGDTFLKNELKAMLMEMVIGPKDEYEGGPYPSFDRIPPGHPLYHCFFDFQDIPPDGATQEYGAVPYKTPHYLEGLWIGDRLVAVYSDRGYGLMWGANSRNREQLKMAVNMVVYALIQQKGFGRGEWYTYRYQ